MIIGCKSTLFLWIICIIHCFIAKKEGNNNGRSPLKWILSYFSLLLVGIFAEFSEDTDSALRMQESDLKAISALAGSFVDEANALAIALCERFSYAVLDAESDMMNASTTIVEIFLNGCTMHFPLPNVLFFP